VTRVTDTDLRCFLAIEIPTAARERLAASLAQLETELPELRVVRPENLHVTLKFVGDFPEAAIPRLAQQCASKLIPIPPFELSLAGLGTFPHARAATVVWIGIRAGASQLARIARKLDSAAGRLGARRDRRPYQPHLTLGRLREPRAIALGHLPVPDPIDFRVEDIVLYESRLSPSGATHLPLARLPMGRPPEDHTYFAPDF